MRNTARFLMIFAVSLIAASVAAARPGTPNKEMAWECYPDHSPHNGGRQVVNKSTFLMTPRPYDGLPQVCAHFTNTAIEDVRFEVEMTENGQPVSGIGRGIDCFFYRNGINAQRWTGKGCTAAYNFGGNTGMTTNVVDGPQTSGDQGVIFFRASYGNEYCFRFRARDASNDMVSLKWSNWTCAKTRTAPTKPAKPQLVSVAALEPGWTEDFTTSMPHRIQVDWNTVKPEFVGHFTIVAKATDAKYKAIEKVISPETAYLPTDRQATFNVPPGMIPANKGEVPEFLISVCAHNLVGSTCSVAKSTSVSEMDPGKYADPGDINPDVVGKTKPPARTADPGTIGHAQADDSYVGTAKPKGSSKATDSIFAAPKQPKNMSDMYAAPATSAPGGIIVRSAEATQPANFTATWDTITAANAHYTMTLTQNGNGVSGSYRNASGAGGSLSGIVNGNTLTYRWEEGANSGSGKFTLASDGNAFTGWWNYAVNNPNAVEGSWNGTKQ